jgi:antitoxin component of RelBE/YafQ-DinJ toxin-antitoxin module
MVTITIKENSKQAKSIIEYLKTLPFVTIHKNEKIPNATTIKAMKDAEKGIVFAAKNTDDLIKKLNR